MSSHVLLCILKSIITEGEACDVWQLRNRGDRWAKTIWLEGIFCKCPEGLDKGEDTCELNNLRGLDILEGEGGGKAQVNILSGAGGF